MLVEKSLYDTREYENMLQRIHKLTPQTSPNWGKMNVGQMLAHCAEIIEVMNGKELKNTPLIVKLLKGIIRKAVVNQKPYPKNSQTHPQYKQVKPKDFMSEKARLLAALEAFKHMPEDEANLLKHGLFGTMSKQERGWSNYKHLDYHLAQFGV